jgi:hypothetical protein
MVQALVQSLDGRLSIRSIELGLTFGIELPGRPGAPGNRTR